MRNPKAKETKMKKTTEEKISYYENQRVRAIERGSDPMEMAMIERGLETCYKELDKK
jgi:hypothetical protein